MLYPLKFEPIYKERIWGGEKLRNEFNRITPSGKPIGESWEISALEGDVSVVSNGNLAGNELNELIEVYMGELVGDRVYNRFGEEFPLLIKLLDTKDQLSIQVHPDNELAAERHNAYGKTEMWYVIDAEKDAHIYLGFNKTVTPEEVSRRIAEGTLTEVLNKIPLSTGDAYFIPAGTVHALGAGLFVAEIQQSSDITYRIDDWGRTDAEGNPRELHVDLALDAIDYARSPDLKLAHDGQKNRSLPLKSCPEFVTNVIELDGKLERDYLHIDSFVIYMCIRGEVIVECEGGAESLMDAETVLIPAEFEAVTLTGKGTLLEIYMPA